MALTRKIGLLLLLPVLGALASLSVFFALHSQTAEDAPVINLAGRQRLHAQQLLAYADMVRAGQEKDRAALLELTDLYERALTILEHGGEFMGQAFPPAPAAVLDEIAEIRQVWESQGAALRLIARRAVRAPGVEDAYRAAQLNTPPLVAAADKVVTALAQRNQALQQRTLNALLGSAAFNFLLLFAGIFITRQYVTEQKHIEGTLREAAERRRRLMETANDAIFIADVETGEIVECNKKASELIGLPPEQLVGLHQSKLHPPELAEYYRQKFRENSRPEGALIKDVLVQHRDGRRIPVEISASTLELDGKTYVQGIFRDVSERKRAETALHQSEERLQHLVHYDPLTQLPNRVLFLDRLEQALARATWHKRPTAVLHLDLDRFKVINDTVGHPIGDRVLKVIAERLNAAVRKGDTVARLGGDEFVVALADLAEVHDVPRVAEKLIAALHPPVVIDGREYFVTASIGVSLHPWDGDDAETLLRNADVAMYRAKEKGKNNFQFYSPAMNAEAPRRLAIETDLRRALERREFLLHYQPKVDLATGRVAGMEALLRWQHPKQGLISPLDFIPLLEETGLIVPVGEWVLRSACAQNRSWQEAGLAPLRVAVNLSARQFKQPGLVEMVGEVLAEVGLDPGLLELELTESILLEHTEESLATLRRFHDMGIHLALDDFGTGYSSLSYLKRFPIDSLKIDRSFIHDVTTNPDDATIARTVIAMAHNLRMTAVAEGVETREQLEFLRSHECDQMQGYYFSRPLAAEAFAQLLADNRCLGTEPGS
jgi:diguanylate cyclase (GGDEF)-like protein/PAS domain S-box-containing protein